ncbi:hypothetical protein Agub_g1093, partial [Astrephomene gubernaculifera]
GELVQPGRELLLRGKLLLVRELVRALDRLGLGLSAPGRPGLIALLLNRYLFPEAGPLWQPDPPPAAAEAALAQAAGDPGARREALALLQLLMTRCPANLEQGFRELRRLHFDNGLRVVDRKFDISGEGVRCGPRGGYVGLRNGGATCYMNSVLQQLFMQPRIRGAVLAAAGVAPGEQQDSVFHQLQVMFAHLRLGGAACFHPRGFWQSFKDYDGQPIDVREHQDAYEFFTRLQDAVDSHLRSTGQPPAMQAVMGGKFAAQVICRDVPYRSEREEEFYQISVEVAGCGSLERSLSGYVAGELLEGENSYLCEELGARVAAVRRTVIKQLPHTLVVHLKRFEYDHINMTRYKLRDRFEFPVLLDMFKYTAEGVAAQEAAAGAAGTSTTGAGTAAGGEDSHAAAAGSSEEGGRPRSSYLYELKGIVVHSGTAFAGHYYSFIKERPRMGEDGQVSEGGWYRFDDKLVTPWSINDLEADCFGGRASSSAGGGAGAAGGGRAGELERPYSAYMLFYERREEPSYDGPAADKRAVPRDMAAAAAEGESGGRSEGAGMEGAAAAVPAGTAGGAEDMETDGPGAALQPPQQPQPPLPTTPYGMPLPLYRGVLRENLRLQHKLHVLNKEYFGFVRQVVEVSWEAVLAGRKTRRRDLLQGGGGGGGSSGAAAHSGPAPTPMSPGATATATNTTTATSSGAEASSAPSQRNEELDETVLLSSQLAAAFLLHLYLPAPAGLRGDMEQWGELVREMLRTSPRACLELLRQVTASQAVQESYFVRWAKEGEWLAEVLSYALQVASRAASPLQGSITATPNSGGAALAHAATAGVGGGGVGGEDGGGAAAAVAQQLQSVALNLARALCELAFAPLHDERLVPPQYVPLCRTLAALVGADVAVAGLVLRGHLRDAFSLPGYLLREAGEAAEEEVQAGLEAALGLLHAMLRYCSTSAQMQVQVPGGGPGGLVLEALRLDTIGAGGGGGAAGGGGGGAAAGGRSSGGAAPPRVLLDLSRHLEELVAADGGSVFFAALWHSGLLGAPRVRELLRFLTAGSSANTVALLDAIFARLSPQQAGSPAVLELLEGLPAVVDLHDSLRVARLHALLFGGPQLRS